ncbi:hypothetical protein [Glaciecola sp. KUL10]|uniref:hypothetical protein n=1 Tax=Glaciecola sp. (strain KUL10) TaxID=2161813 RepID=UPI000D787EF4|nr:hypothetical protein [Glaciecola sp. KUL10]GBL02953.1 ABC transporter, ATP-binding protein [Glaciecola sp. KUL10]
MGNDIQMDLSTLKLRCSLLNRKLASEELQVWESGTQWCVLYFVKKADFEVISILGVNLNAKRDRCLTKAWLSFIENSYAPALEKQAA